MRRFALLLISACLLPVPAVQAGSTAADLYKTKCVMCHGQDGAGNTPMGKKLGLRDLRAEATQSQSDAQLTAIIESGKGKMPSQKGRLTKDETRQLVGLLRELAKKH